MTRGSLQYVSEKASKPGRLIQRQIGDFCENLSSRSAARKIEVTHSRFVIWATWIWNTKWWNPPFAPVFGNKRQDFLLVFGFVPAFQWLVTPFLPSCSARGSLWRVQKRGRLGSCVLLQITVDEMAVFLFLCLFSGSFLASIYSQSMA